MVALDNTPFFSFTNVRQLFIIFKKELFKHVKTQVVLKLSLNYKANHNKIYK